MTVRKPGHIERTLARFINGVAAQLNKINKWLIKRDFDKALAAEFEREWAGLEAKRRPRP